MEQKQKYKRSLKNLYINPRFQLKVLLLTFLLCFISQGSLLSFQYLAFQQINSETLTSGSQSAEQLKFVLDDFKYSIYESVAISFGIGLFLCFIIISFLTHRIAGPIRKMTLFFEEVARDPNADKKIYFRNGDYFRELAEAYNKRFN